MNAQTSPRQNRLLAALPEAELQRWLAQLEWTSLPLGQVIYESGRPLSHVYFPTTAIVSLLYVLEDGASAEIAVVGNEGMSASLCSWEANRPRAGRWCKAPVRASG